MTQPPSPTRLPEVLPLPVVAATEADRTSLDQLLRSSGLPVLACDEAATGFTVAREGDGAVVGCAGAVLRGSVALIHAIAVAPHARARGVGTSLMMDLLRRLVGSGVQVVAMQAFGGQSFVSRFGFLAVPLAQLPSSVREACPEVADGNQVAAPMLLDVGAAALVVPASRNDMPAVLAIYNDAVAQSTATYDYEPRTLEEQLALFDQKMVDGYGFFVARTMDGTVAGFSTYGLYRTRPGWRFACEHSVYVAAPWRGRRVGLMLLPPVMRHARKRGFHTMVGVVDADNLASTRMHCRAGFQVIGTMREGGYKFDRWLDVAFLQAML